MYSVNVLLSTYNGEKYLSELLDSVFNQTDVKIVLHIRDDGSTDNTINILKEYESHPLVGSIIYGDNIGYKESFIQLAKKHSEYCDFVAFCDQDDKWLSNKLSSAIDKLILDNNKYSLYISSMQSVNYLLEPIKLKQFNNYHTLGASFTRHNAAGCTMVFSSSLCKMATRLDKTYGIISHDLWLYKVSLIMGGKIVYDENSYILYRQHEENTTGLKQGIIKRIRTEIRENFKYKNQRVMTANLLLELFKNEINYESKKLLIDISKYKKSFLKRFRLAFDKRLRFGNLLIDTLRKIYVIIGVF